MMKRAFLAAVLAVWCLASSAAPQSDFVIRLLELRWGIQASSCVGPGKSNLPFELSGRAGDCSRVTEGQKRPHLGLFPGPNVPLQGR